ncbi:GspE/PulE family protein [Salegentibacter sp. JZCK2]|uniref:GspE/PulE family protein n=1 Tax=Salegentibacter tibetensis TaxID=2873600 RepID=UPI001CCBCE34|nr:GspE/PulE family protein [Salegentibacter tibetensis]MBZ9731350.1 GspE/PulE family protein [Salegentibacter tibetensis]
MDNLFNIPVALKQLITANQAFHHRIVPVEKSEDKIVFKTDSENLHELEQELQVLFGYGLKLEQETSTTLQSYLSLNYRQTTTTETQELNFKNNFLQQLLQTAKDYGSSDIHLEPYEDRCRVRFRLDGKLKEQFSIASIEYPQIINQIKIQAGLDISQKRLSQDGRITVKSSNQDFDIRVSTLPTLHGEKIVLRILKRDAEEVSLTDLGFTKKELSLYLEGIKKPNGIVLISGPTGSGKTTTLYGTLKLLNQESTNILTIEDPIEYTLAGINQVQLKEDIGFDFPAALRTFLRQDPDIIMVGEIRDEKTATMAIKAALTGHLVLSTIHTNSAWSTVSRLIDMGIPPYLISSTLNTSVAQRLVRKLCDDCKQPAGIEKAILPPGFKVPSKMIQHFLPTGCPKCFHTGYRGRKAIYEIIPVTKSLEFLIKENEFQIDNFLKEKNLSTLKINAERMIIAGETSIEEVYSLLNSEH